MVDKKHIQAGLDQMDFRVIDNGTLELPSSTPATYKFTEPTTYNPEQFAEQIDGYGFSTVGMTTNTKDSDWYYYTDVLTDHCKTVHVKIWTDKANVYPKEDGIDTWEFSRILSAIEEAFGSELQHTPDDE